MFRNFVAFFDVKKRLTVISIDNAVNLGLLSRVSPSEYYKSIHLIANDGKIFSAGKAIPILIGLLNSETISNCISGSKSLIFVMECIYNIFAKAKYSLNCGNTCRTKMVQ